MPAAQTRNLFIYLINQAHNKHICRSNSTNTSNKNRNKIEKIKKMFTKDNVMFELDYGEFSFCVIYFNA